MQFVTELEEGDWLVFNNLRFRTKPGKIILELKAADSGGSIELRRGTLQGEVIASCAVQSTGGEWSKQSFEVQKLKKKEKVYFVFKGSNESLAIKNFIFE